MRVANSEEEIISFGEGRGSTDCALKAFRQGKRVFLCSPQDGKDCAKKIIRMMEGGE